MWTSLLLALCAPALAQDHVDWAELAAEFDGRGDRDRALIAWARSLVDHDTPEARRELARLAEGRAALRFTLHVPGVDDRYWPGWVLSTAAGRVATGWDDVRIFDERTGALVCEPLPVAPRQLALDPTGTHVAVIEVGDRAAVWDIASRQREFELVPGWGRHRRHLCAITWSCCRRRVVSVRRARHGSIRISPSRQDIFLGPSCSKEFF